MSNNQNGQHTAVERINPETGEIVGMSPSFSQPVGIDSDLHNQIATAKRYPRSVKAFRNKVLELATLNEAVAGECVYALPRGGKNIEGASIRFAEIVLNAWGNCRVAGKVVGEKDGFLVCQGMFHDLESNAAIAIEVERRITDKNGKRYNDDMVGVAGAAGTAIALRNAILRGVPKAFWADMYDSARKVVAGDFKTLANRRHAAMQAFVIYGVDQDQILALLKAASIEEVTIDHLVELRGILNAIKDGSSTPEDVFGVKAAVRPEKKLEKKPEAKVEAKAVEAKAEVLDAAEPTPELTRAITLLGKITDITEIDGMRPVLREDLSPDEYAVWQHEALKREASFKKGRGR